MSSAHSNSAEASETTIVVDGHVHVHDCYELEPFLRAAVRRLNRVELPFPGPREGVLMLTECSHENFFERTRENLAQGGEGTFLAEGFRLHATDEPASLRVSGGEITLTFVAGCQVATTDGLEVLMLATDRRVPDGLSMRETLDRSVESGGLSVIPWGVGKWWGGRGKLMRDLIQEYADRGLFLGDESGRPWFWPRPGLIDEAAGAGVRDLPGTDPLPFRGEEPKVGRMGFALRAGWDPARPAGSLMEALGRSGEQPHRFARLESAIPFFHNQFRMQLRKRQG